MDTTKISGFFNNNPWPIQLVISSLNVSLRLQPGEFILDKNGQKINDPFFEVYAKAGPLSRELADVPVPVIRIPNAASLTQKRRCPGLS